MQQVSQSTFLGAGRRRKWLVAVSMDLPRVSLTWPAWFPPGTVLQVDGRVADVIFIEFSKAFKDFSIIFLYSRWDAAVGKGKSQTVCSLDRCLALEGDWIITHLYLEFGNKRNTKAISTRTCPKDLFRIFSRGWEEKTETFFTWCAMTSNWTTTAIPRDLEEWAD